MESRHRVAEGRVPGGSWTSCSAAPRPEEPACCGCRAAARARRSPRGRGSQLDAHLAQQPPEQETLPLGKMREPGLRAGARSGHSEKPLTFRPIWEVNRRRTMGPGVGLQRRVRPTSALSYAPLRRAAPTSSHFQHPLNPRQRKRAKVGIAWGRKVRPLGILSI